MKKTLLMLLAAGTALVMTGCRVPSYDVTVCVSPKFVDLMKVYPSLEMDIIGVNPNEMTRLKSVAVEEYFEYNGALRKSSDKCTVYFSEDNVTPKLLKSDHPIWKTFAAKDADQLVLIANIPGNAPKDAAQDPRKLVIPLKSVGVFGSSERFVELAPSGVLLLKTKPENLAEAEEIGSAKE